MCTFCVLEASNHPSIEIRRKAWRWSHHAFAISPSFGDADAGVDVLQQPHYYLMTPLPLAIPLPTPLPALLAAVPLALPPLPIPLPALPLAAAPRPGAMDCLELVAEGGAEYLLAGLPLVGGFSTNDVSVVRNVASGSVVVRSRKGEFWSCDGMSSLCRAND